MKKRMGKMTACALSALLVFGVASGCGTKKDTAATDQVVISIADFDNPNTNPQAYELAMKEVQKFEELYPNIKVEPVDWRFDTQSYMAKAEGNTLPTTYYVPLTEAQNIMDLGYAADVTNEFKARGFYDNIADFMLESISRDGKVYMVPTGCYDVGLAVNLNLYEQLGLVEADGTPHQPQTWDELAQIAVKVKEKTGKSGFVLPTTGNAGGWRFTPIAWSFGVTFEEKVDGKWKAAFNSPECVAALQFIKDLKWKYDVLPANTLVDLTEVQKQIGSGECAMTLGEPNQVNQYSKFGIDIDRIGVMKIPSGPKRRVSLMGGGYQIINKNATSEQLKAAMDWLEYKGHTMKLTDERKESILSGIKTSTEKGNIVGLETLSPWKETCEVEIYKKQAYQENANVNLNHIKLYNDKTGVEFQAEEPIEAQALYGVLDSCVQEVLTNKDADCAKVIKDAAEDFQKNHLDYVD